MSSGVPEHHADDYDLDFLAFLGQESFKGVLIKQYVLKPIPFIRFTTYLVNKLA